MTECSLKEFFLDVLAFFFYPSPDAHEVNDFLLDNQPSIGYPDAAFVLTEFGDFTCSACKSWHQMDALTACLDRNQNQKTIEHDLDLEFILKGVCLSLLGGDNSHSCFNAATGSRRAARVAG